MQTIIDAIDRNSLEQELSKAMFVRMTNYGNNEIYIFTGPEAPLLMKEVGRLREISFRLAGGGTGAEMDVDEFDMGAPLYKQLIVWNPIDKEIVGGYRYIKLSEVTPDKNGHVHLASSHMFGFSDRFLKDYFPFTIELGRSFVQPKYQPTKDSRRGIFSLDNLWDGLGALFIDNPEVKYFFGKMTMYLRYDRLARDLILHFLFKYFPDPDQLVVPFHPLPFENDRHILEGILNGGSYDEDHKIMLKFVRSRGEAFPPLVNAYMNLSASMHTFGSSYNEQFGEVEEIGILVKIDDIYESKKHRHIATYQKGMR